MKHLPKLIGTVVILWLGYLIFMQIAGTTKVPEVYPDKATYVVKEVETNPLDLSLFDTKRK